LKYARGSADLVTADRNLARGKGHAAGPATRESGPPADLACQSREASSEPLDPDLEGLSLPFRERPVRRFEGEFLVVQRMFSVDNRCFGPAGEG